MYKIKVGISACLLGQEVRFDGGHKRSSFCERDLGAHFDYHPVCPEMAIGLGAPRAAPAGPQGIPEQDYPDQTKGGPSDFSREDA